MKSLMRHICVIVVSTVICLCMTGASAAASKNSFKKEAPTPIRTQVGSFEDAAPVEPSPEVVDLFASMEDRIAERQVVQYFDARVPPPTRRFTGFPSIPRQEQQFQRNMRDVNNNIQRMNTYINNIRTPRFQ